MGNVCGSSRSGFCLEPFLWVSQFSYNPLLSQRGGCCLGQLVGAAAVTQGDGTVLAHCCAGRESGLAEPVGRARPWEWELEVPGDLSRVGERYVKWWRCVWRSDPQVRTAPRGHPRNVIEAKRKRKIRMGLRAQYLTEFVACIWQIVSVELCGGEMIFLERFFFF